MVTEAHAKQVAVSIGDGMMFFDKDPSLVAVIRSVENLPDYLHPDKRASQRFAFETVAEREPLVARVRDQQTTFHDEYQRVVGEHPLLRSLIPWYFSEQRRKDAAVFDGLTGESIVAANLSERLFGYIINPGGLATFVGVGLPIIDAILSRKIDLERMQVAGAIGALSGFGVGAIFWMIRAESFGRIRNNARYLDERIRDVYRTDTRSACQIGGGLGPLV